MLVTRISPFSGKTNVMDIPFTPENEEMFLKMEQKNALGITVWRVPGMLIRDAFSNLTADQREFLMTGITPEEWDEVFGTKNDA